MNLNYFSDEMQRTHGPTEKELLDARMREKYEYDIGVKKTIGFNVNMPRGYVNGMQTIADAFEKDRLTKYNLYNGIIMWNPSIRCLSEYLFIRHYPESMKKISKDIVSDFRLLLEDNKFEYLHVGRFNKEKEWINENIYKKYKTIEPTENNMTVLKLKITGGSITIEEEEEEEVETVVETVECKCEGCGGEGCVLCKLTD